MYDDTNWAQTKQDSLTPDPICVLGRPDPPADFLSHPCLSNAVTTCLLSRNTLPRFSLGIWPFDPSTGRGSNGK